MFSRGICRVKENTALEPWEFGHKRGERERLNKKTLQNKNTLPFQLECKLRKPSIFVITWVESTHTYFHMHNYNYFRTLCIKLMRSFNISSCDFIKICLLLEETKLIWDWKRSFGGWKEVQRQDEDRVTLLKVRVFFFFFFGQFFEETQSIILWKSFLKTQFHLLFFYLFWFYFYF
jgi:hypothetical protein